MKNVTLLAALTLLIFGFGSNAFAYESGTKIIATMSHPQSGEVQFGPLLVVSHEELTPSKPIVGLLYRVPQPTLSVERIREEKQGQSLGTKMVVLFQR